MIFSAHRYTRPNLDDALVYALPVVVAVLLHEVGAAVPAQRLITVADYGAAVPGAAVSKRWARVLIFRGVGPEGSVLDPVGGGARVSSVEQVEL
jgi:hypothetical protein